MFKALNNTQPQRATPALGEQQLCVAGGDVRTLSRVNPCKAAGPDDIPGRELSGSTVQLTDTLTDILNISLSHAVVPASFKRTTIIPVPKESSASCLNNYAQWH